MILRLISKIFLIKYALWYRIVNTFISYVDVTLYISSKENIILEQYLEQICDVDGSEREIMHLVYRKQSYFSDQCLWVWDDGYIKIREDDGLLFKNFFYRYKFSYSLIICSPKLSKNQTMHLPLLTIQILFRGDVFFRQWLKPFSLYAMLVYS